jgi:hypothetical protein
VNFVKHGASGYPAKRGKAVCDVANMYPFLYLLVPLGVHKIKNELELAVYRYAFFVDCHGPIELAA